MRHSQSDLGKNCFLPLDATHAGFGVGTYLGVQFWQTYWKLGSKHRPKKNRSIVEGWAPGKLSKVSFRSLSLGISLLLAQASAKTTTEIS
jgi:hypothetical protein